jgi:hypothetical protein
MKERHVVALPLWVNKRQAMILDQKFQVLGKLRNALLQTLLRQMDAMRSDPRWATAKTIVDPKQRSRAYWDLRREFSCDKFATRRIVIQHWQDSKWMGDLVDSHTALALASEVLQNTEEWLFGRAQRPSFKPSANRCMAWGSDNTQGLVYKDNQVRWNTKPGAKGKLKRKSLFLKADLGNLTQDRREHLLNSLVVRTGIVREQVRGATTYSALLCLDGKPYRDVDYASSLSEACVALDLGPSLVAAVGPTNSVILPLVTPSLLALRQHHQQVERRRMRALQRSRRASSPHCFDTNGSWRKGQRQNPLSVRGQHRQALLATTKRSNASNRLQDRQRVIRSIIQMGTTVVAEKIDYRTWQRSGYGKRMGWTAPGDFMVRLGREAKLFGGRMIELPLKLALSQYCLCGVKLKKPLFVRVHHCATCGLGPLHRDLFSAFLARLVVVSNLDLSFVDLAQAPFNTEEIRGQATALCAVRPLYAACVTGVSPGIHQHEAGVLKLEVQGDVPGVSSRMKVKSRPQEKTMRNVCKEPSGRQARVPFEVVPLNVVGTVTKGIAPHGTGGLGGYMKAGQG